MTKQEERMLIASAILMSLSEIIKVKLNELDNINKPVFDLVKESLVDYENILIKGENHD